MIPIVLYASSLALGAIGAWFIARFASRIGLLDQPTDRSSHARPTPKGGGIGILLAFIAGCISQDISMSFWLPVAILSIVSLVGDRIHLNPGLRLMIQFGIAFLCISRTNLYSSFTGNGVQQGLVSPVLILAIATFIVGTANFYNFMDGINGIAGITGVVAFGLLGSFGLWSGQSPALTALSFVIALACCGFLPFNVPQARVFMGDVGSILLGFLFAYIVVSFAKSVTRFAVLVCFLFPFYLDELVSMVERVKNKQRLSQPHRTHLYQVMANEAGIKHWKVALGYGLSQLLIGFSVWIAALLDFRLVLPLAVVFSVLFVLFNNRFKSQYFSTRLGNN